MLVAGSLEWEVELTANPSLSGSFYRIEKIPVLSEENAVEAAIRRIYSFLTPNAPRPTVVREPLRQAFRVLSTRLLNPPTFRDYLDHVRDRLVGRHFAEIGISVTLHMESIESVRREIQNSRMAQAYQQFSDPSHRGLSFRKALRVVLPSIYVRKGIPESDYLFRTNKGAFLALRNRGFIVPRRSQSANVLIWHLSPDLVSFLQQVYDKHRITPTDTLEALFIDPAESLPQEAETIYTHVKAQMRSMAAS